MKSARATLATLIVAAVLTLATAGALWAASTGWGLPGPMEQPFQLPPTHPAASPDRDPFP